jgi:hypothetical protein
MKKMIQSMIVCVILSVLTCSAFGSDSLVLREHSFNMGLLINSYEYTEPDLMKIDGMMYGVYLDYTYHSPNRIMLGGGIEFGRGDLTYTGSTWGGDPLESDTTDWLYELRALIGYDLPIQNIGWLTPFIGIGNRYLNDDGEGDGSYEREIWYWYSPFGLRLNTKPAPEWEINFTAEYDLFLDGEVSSQLSQVDPRLNDITVKQDGGYGLRFSVGLNYGNFGVIPYYQYWKIDQSDEEILTFYGYPLGTVVEPDNETKVFGLKIEYRF